MKLDKMENCVRKKYPEVFVSSEKVLPFRLRNSRPAIETKEASANQKIIA